jgi:hypothetical protein
VGRRQNLEIEQAPPVERRTQERRREPRYTVERLRQTGDQVIVYFRGHPCSVYDLSTRGLCFLSPGMVGSQSIGQEFESTVSLCGEQVQVRFRITDQRDFHVGCELVHAPSPWHAEVGKLLDPLRIGRQLKEVAEGELAARTGPSQVRWFQGGPACDLYVWTDAEGCIDKVQLFFMWQMVEWARDTGLRSGAAASPPARAPNAGSTQSESYELRAPPDTEALTTARRILAASRVPPQILQLFTS